jgi:hypothetical protein
MRHPARTPKLLTRLFRLGRAFENPTELTHAMEDSRSEVWSYLPAQTRKTTRALTGMLNFQPGLVSLHRDQTTTTAYLYTLVAAAETNLNLADPTERALYTQLHTAARQSETLDRFLVTVATTTIASPDAPALQTS